MLTPILALIESDLAKLKLQDHPWGAPEQSTHLRLKFRSNNGMQEELNSEKKLIATKEQNEKDEIQKELSYGKKSIKAPIVQSSEEDPAFGLY